MPIFPNQYAEKLNPKNEDKILLADSESGSAIKSVQAKKVADLVLPITNDSLADNAVTASKIANGAVTTSKITDASVTGAKISSGSTGVGNANLLTTAGDIGGAWKAYTATIVGFASLDDSTIRYTQIGKTIIMYLSIAGTSNATNFTISAPVAAKVYTTAIVWITDNTSIVRSGLMSLAGSTIMVYSDPSGAPWTNSGKKRLRQAIFTYEAAA